MELFWRKVKSSFSVVTIKNENQKRISSVIIINLLLAGVSLGKDILLARYMGTTAEADAFLLVYFIIDTIGNNLVANALGVAIIPVLAGLLEREDQQSFVKISRRLVIYALVFSVLLSLLMYQIRSSLLSVVGVGFSGSSKQLSIGLFNVLIPSIIIFPLINIGISILQVQNRFNIPALAPVLFNLVLLIGLINFLCFNLPLAQGVYGIALLILIGVIVMFILVWVSIIKNGLISVFYRDVFNQGLSMNQFNERTNHQFWSLSSDIINMGKSFLLYLIVILFPQITYLFERYLASNLETGSISALNFAFRIVQFPLWVFIAAVSSVLFPTMSKFSANRDNKGFNTLLMNSINSTLVFTLPFSIILFVLRFPIISILLQGGEFNSHSVSVTANIMAGYSLTIIWQGFSIIWVRATLIEGRMIYSLVAAVSSTASAIVLDCILVPIMGSAGLGYGAAFGTIINFAAIYFLFSHSRKLCLSQYWRRFVKIVLANLPLLLVAIMESKLWVWVSKHNSGSFRFGYVVIVVTLCLCAYWLGLTLFQPFPMFSKNESKPH